MIQEIKMPDAGQTTDEARIVSVKVHAGDTIRRGDVLVEAETDKAVLPVESFAAGVVLEVRVREGDEVHAGDMLAAVGSEADRASYQPGGKSAAPAASAPAASAPAAPAAEDEDEYRPILPGAGPQSAPRSAPAAAPQAAGGAFPAMPGAKALAREQGVDLSGVTASNGAFITRRDVLAAKSAAPAAAGAPAVHRPAHDPRPQDHRQADAGEHADHPRLAVHDGHPDGRLHGAAGGLEGEAGRQALL
jgi:pyruvate dehydrogenase E2 component (dihydrolipoamide acetyltransferase)